MSILKIKNEKGEWQGVTSVKGDKGDPGVSPDITVHKNDRKTYQLKINTKDRMFTTPNLRPDESAYIGNTDGELGTIDNWYDPPGHRVTAALTELPALPRLQTNYSTRYIFDHDVVMYTMDGDPNDADICSWEQYTRREGSEIEVPPNGQEFLTDYIIYNARPKYEWDTWESKQLMKKVNGYPDMWANWDRSAGKYIHPGCPFQPGNWNWVSAVMVHNNQLPAVCDEGLLDWGKPDEKTGEYTQSPVTMELDINTQPLEGYVYWAPEMKSGKWLNIMQLADGNCCGESDQWGISKLIGAANREPAAREQFPKEMAWSIVSESDLKKKHADGRYLFDQNNAYKGIMVALSPSKYYTIESLNGPVAIFSPCSGFNIYGGEASNHYRHVTKWQRDLYETKLETITIERRQESQIVGAEVNGATGKVPVGGDKVLGTTVSYYTNDNPNYCGRAEVPTILRCPNKVIEKGEHCTFRLGNTWQNFSFNYQGVFLFCQNEEDYAGIKITEGIEPYSVMEAERIASGATKFNMKVRFGSVADGFPDDADRYEYNIRLVDTTEDDGYVRYLTNEIKKSYYLDEFSLVGHHHTMDDIEDLQDLADTIPKMTVSTQTLSDGYSPLEENNFYFVYEGE